MVDAIFADDMHAARVASLANATTGVMTAASLSIHLIGQGLAAAEGGDAKHAIKQVDRLLSNAKLGVWDVAADWVAFVLADRKEALIALDWTEFGRDGHATIVASLITSHGRSTPLVWKTVAKAELADHRNDFEDEVLRRLQEVIRTDVAVTLIADRAFGDQKLYDFLDRMGWGFVIRFRENITVTFKGERKAAAAWVPDTGRARMLKDAAVTTGEAAVAAVVVVRAPAMKEAWCLATNRDDVTAAAVVKLYGRRFTIEEAFRDSKDPRFGLGLGDVRVGRVDRRDRLFLLAALAQALLTILGAASEETGLDRTLKANTVKRRVHSLFRQGCFWYSALPNMKPDRARLLLAAFDRQVRQHAVFRGLFGVL